MKMERILKIIVHHAEMDMNLKMTWKMIKIVMKYAVNITIMIQIITIIVLIFAHMIIN